MLSPVVPANNGVVQIPPLQGAIPAAASAHFSSSNPASLWQRFLSGLGMGGGATSAPPGQFRPGFFLRRERARYASDASKVDQLRANAARFLESGERDDAAEAYMRLAVRIWSLSQNYAVGLWDEAEDAMVRGALIMAGRDPEGASDEGEVRRYAVPVLLERKKIRREFSLPAEGLYVISRELGMGGQATVWKIFGRDEIFKFFDGGGMQFSTEFPPSLLENKRLSVEREIDGFGRLRDVGLEAVRVYEIGDMWYRKELVYGIVRRGIEIVLGFDEIPIALERLERYKQAMLVNGVVGFDGNYAGNFVYRRDGKWVVTDF